MMIPHHSRAVGLGLRPLGAIALPLRIPPPVTFVTLFGFATVKSGRHR
jgi:hypothetical protein